MRVGEHGSKLQPLLRALPAAAMVHVLAYDLMAGTDAPSPELPELVLRVLAFVVRRYPPIDPHAHSRLSRLKKDPLQDTDCEGVRPRISAALGRSISATLL